MKRPTSGETRIGVRAIGTLVEVLRKERQAKLNWIMIGGANYFCLGPVSKAYRAVEQHARKRLRQ